MSLVDVAERTRVASVDNHLAQLARELQRVRGEYAAEATVLERIDVLLDRRLRLTGYVPSRGPGSPLGGR